MSKNNKTTNKNQDKTDQATGKLSPGQYEKIGRIMEQFVATGYSNRFRLFSVSIIRGVGSGFGAVLGGTIVVAILLYILNFFEEVPLLGDFVQKLINALPN